MILHESAPADILTIATRILAYFDTLLRLEMISPEEHIISCGELKRWLEKELVRYAQQKRPPPVGDGPC